MPGAVEPGPAPRCIDPTATIKSPSFPGFRVIWEYPQPPKMDESNTTIITTTTTTTTTVKERVAASGYRISLGLVEISALATLIGAANAEALALGLASAVGLPWAPISTFGAVHVIKVSLAAVMSDRIREALGLRSASVDSALGMILDIDHTKAETHNSGSPCAVLLPYTDLEIAHETFLDSKEVRGSSVQSVAGGGRRPQAVYTFEKSATNILANIPSTAAGDPLEIYQFSQDRGPGGHHNTSYDRIALGASLLKLVEVYALWQAGATAIWWISAIAWLHGVLCAALLQLLGLSRDSQHLGQRDIVAGELPSPLLPGGARKLLLGLPCNVRRHAAWRAVWGTGTLASCVAVLATFISLGAQSIESVYVWVAFQILWLLLRTFVFNLLARAAAPRCITSARPWSAIPTSAKRRVASLAFALAKHQITVHPRGCAAYAEDLLDPTAIAALYRAAGARLLPQVPAEKAPAAHAITVVGVVGDTVLRAAGWMCGAGGASADVYDCALAFVDVAGAVFAVPGVRVLSGLPAGDVEGRVSNFEPRGTTNNGFAVAWEYWVPLADARGERCWVEARGATVVGAKTGVVGTAELQRKLQGGGLNISLTQVGEVERILEESRRAAEVLVRFLVDAEF